MTTIELKNVLNEQIDKINDKNFLETIKMFIDSKAESHQIQLSEYQKKRIAESRKQIRNGQYIDNDLLNQKVEKWLNNRN
jgi:hypothetical protein